MIKTTTDANWHPLDVAETVYEEMKEASKPRIKKFCKRLEETKAELIARNPDLRFVAVTSSDKRPQDAMVFHSIDGITWVPQPCLLPDLESLPSLAESFNRGAEALDGQDHVSSTLTRANALLRMGYQADWGPTADHKADLKTEIDDTLDEAAEIYVSGSTTEEGRRGREVSVETIRRTIAAIMDRQREDLDAAFKAREPDRKASKMRSDVLDAADVADDYELFLARQYMPFLRNFAPIGEWPGETKTARRKRKICIWADAAGLPRDADFREIHGRLLAMSKGHPIFGDAAFARLSDLLAEHLARGEHVVLLGGRLFIREGGRWRAAQRKEEGDPSWTEGVVVSQNHGRLVIPPFWRDGQLHDGYTRNGPGEGASKPRRTPERWKIAARELAPSDLAWVHALHEWDSDQG